VTIINELRDLNNIDIELVTGFPDFHFADLDSPITMQAGMDDFLAALRANVALANEQDFDTYWRASLAASDKLAQQVKMPRTRYSPTKQKDPAEFMFLHLIEDFSLPRGETATMPILNARVPYKIIYRWEAPNLLINSADHSQRDAADMAPIAETVWQCCQLANSTKEPWTTASVQFTRNNRFLGQTICPHTPQNGVITVPFNRAVNVLAQQNEHELERTKNAETPFGHKNDLVKMKGELHLQNRLAELVTVKVIKTLSGQVQQCVPRAEDKDISQGPSSLNPDHTLTWEIELSPGKTKILTYTYDVYVTN